MLIPLYAPRLRILMGYGNNFSGVVHFLGLYLLEGKNLGFDISEVFLYGLIGYVVGRGLG